MQERQRMQHPLTVVVVSPISNDNQSSSMSPLLRLACMHSSAAHLCARAAGPARIVQAARGRAALGDPLRAHAAHGPALRRRAGRRRRHCRPPSRRLRHTSCTCMSLLSIHASIRALAHGAALRRRAGRRRRHCCPPSRLLRHTRCTLMSLQSMHAHCHALHIVCTWASQKVLALDSMLEQTPPARHPCNLTDLCGCCGRGALTGATA